MFTLAKSNSRISALFFYQFNPAPDLADRARSTRA